MRKIYLLVLFAVILFPGCDKSDQSLFSNETITGNIKGKIFVNKTSFSAPLRINQDYLPLDFKTSLVKIAYLNDSEVIETDENGNFEINGLNYGENFLTIYYKNNTAFVKRVNVDLENTENVNLYIDNNSYYETASNLFIRALKENYDISGFLSDEITLTNNSINETITGNVKVTEYLNKYLDDISNKDVQVTIDKINTELSTIKLSTVYYGTIKDSSLGTIGEIYAKYGLITLHYLKNENIFKITSIDIDIDQYDLARSSVMRIIKKYQKEYDSKNITGIASITYSEDKNYNLFLKSLSNEFSSKENINYNMNITSIKIQDGSAEVYSNSEISYIDVVDGRIKEENIREQYNLLYIDGIWKMIPGRQAGNL